MPTTLHPDRTIRTAFLLEASANLGTLPLLTHPRPILSFLLTNPASNITPATILFARLFGGIVVFGLTAALLFGATNTRNGVQSRRPTYVMLGLGEAALIPILGVEGWRTWGGEEAAIGVGVAAGGMVVLGATLLWRVWVLGMRPELLGEWKDGGKRE